MDLYAKNAGVSATLRTARLGLRPLLPEDAPAIAEGLSDWQVTRWLAAPPWPYRLSDAEEYVASPMAVDSRAILAGDNLVGVIGLAENELGYWLARSAWGRGYATEAGRAIVDAAFARGGWTELSSGHQVANLASGRVLAKLGFRPIGQEMRHFGPVGRFLPSVQLRLTRADWMADRQGGPASVPGPG